MATAYAGLKELAGRAIPTPTIRRTKVIGLNLLPPGEQDGGSHALKEADNEVPFKLGADRLLQGTSKTEWL